MIWLRFLNCCTICFCRRERRHSEEMPSLEEINDDISSNQTQLDNNYTVSEKQGSSQRKRRIEEKIITSYVTETTPSQLPPWYLVYDKEHGAIPLSKLQKKYGDKT